MSISRLRPNEKAQAEAMQQDGGRVRDRSANREAVQAQLNEFDPQKVFAEANQKDAEKYSNGAKASAVAGATLEIVGQVAGIVAEGVLNGVLPGAGTAAGKVVGKGAQVVAKGLSSSAGTIVKEGIKLTGKGFEIAANTKSEQASGKSGVTVGMNTAGRTIDGVKGTMNSAQTIAREIQERKAAKAAEEEAVG